MFNIARSVSAQAKPASSLLIIASQNAIGNVYQANGRGCDVAAAISGRILYKVRRGVLWSYSRSETTFFGMDSDDIVFVLCPYFDMLTLSSNVEEIEGVEHLEERRDEKKKLDYLKQDQTMLVIKRSSERKKVSRERKKTGKIRAKRRDDFGVEVDVRVLEEEVVPKVDDVSLVDEVFDGAFGGEGEKDVVMGEGVVVTSSSLEMLKNSCLDGILVSLIFLEGLEEKA
ncbi:hypothetical protein Tco_1266215 [Tanacetum coccineum]